MKRFYLVAALAATAMAAAFFTSCDKQEEVTPPQPESAALGFQSVVTAGLETRAAGDPTPLNASFKINLDTNDAYSTAVNNQEVKYTDGSGYSISPAIYLLKSSRNMVAWAPVGLPELSRRIREQIWALVSDALARSGRTPGTLREITLAGNTVMQHLFAGYSVRGIAAAPFRPETLFAAPGDETLHGVPVHFAPCVAGYVGGDITAGLLAAGLAELPGENLFLDIGTNGEMALGGRGGFVCCAVASGPAFEGAGITCGMPGVDGAISRVRYDRGFLYDVIGGGEPKGLCGSGLLDLTAVLLRLGVIAPGGRLLPPEDAPMPLRRYLTRDDDGNGRFHLTPEVSLTAADVRNLQLAKAAVAAGIRVLLQQRGIAPEQVDGVYLAGGFGSYLDPESAMAIGMLPRACAGKLHTLGNTALAGAAALTLDPAQWQRIGNISRACDYLELSGRADFAAAFTDDLSFPQP